MGKKKRKKIIPPKDQVAMDFDREDVHFKPEIIEEEGKEKKLGEESYPVVIDEEEPGKELGEESYPVVIDDDGKEKELGEESYPVVIDEEEPGKELGEGSNPVLSDLLARADLENAKYDKMIAIIEKKRKLALEKIELERRLAEIRSLAAENDNLLIDLMKK